MNRKTYVEWDMPRYLLEFQILIFVIAPNEIPIRSNFYTKLLNQKDSNFIPYP